MGFKKNSNSDISNTATLLWCVLCLYSKS